jgi:mannose-1-phosphate guanylyltransferase
MSAIINYSLRVDKMPKEKFIAGKDGAVYINLTMSINDETKFGNNAAVFVSQTKEENQEKKPKNYLGNGKVVWNNGTIVNAEKEVKQEVAEAADFPF